jgi:uncharacterized protein DUF748
MFREPLGRLRIWAARSVEWGRSSRRVRRIAIAVASIIVVFGLFGFFGVPAILRHVLTGQVARTLQRPVTVDEIAFNPYRLRLEIENLHIGDRDETAPFVEIGHFHIKLSWKSLFRLAPIVSDLSIDHPDIHIVRTAANRFNFSDLLERPSPPAPEPEKPAPPMRFSVSNIQITNGDIYLDDRFLKQKHSIEGLRLGLPFIASLPSAVDIFVQPLLQMRVDGSPLQLDGRAKPFDPSRESIVDLDLHRLDLPQYVGYVPMKLPVKVAQGKLSSLVRLHFVNTESQPSVRLDGEIAFDTIDVRDLSDAPLAGIKHASIVLSDIRPLERVIRLGRVHVEGLSSHVVLNADGSTNLTPRSGADQPLTASTPAAVSALPTAAAPVQTAPTPAPPSSTAGRPQAAATSQVQGAVQDKAAAPAQPIAITPTPAGAIAVTASSSATAAGTPTPSPAKAVLPAQIIEAQPQPSPTPAQSRAVAQNPKLDFSVDSFELDNGTADLTDRSHPTVASVALSDLRIALTNLHTRGDAAAPYELSAKFPSGGTFAAKGDLQLAKSQVTTDLSLDQLDLAALKAFAEPYLAGDVKAGKLSAKASTRTEFAPGRFNVHVEPANASLDNVNVLAPGASESPIAWDTIAVSVGQVDLATRTAIVKEVRTDGIKLLARRDRKGELNLAALARSAPQASPTTTAPAAEQRQRPERTRARRVQAPQSASRYVGREARPTPAASPTPGNQWHYEVASVALEKTQIEVEDESEDRPLKAVIDPLNLHLKNISSDLAKPITIDLDGTVNRTGAVKVAGTAVPDPLKVHLQLGIRRLDVSPVGAYVARQINAKIVSAALTMSGTADVEKERDKLRAHYSGDVTLGKVRVLDKLTSDTFLRWNALSADRIEANYGSGPPKVHIGGLALSNFYTRVILSSDGRLNFKDIASSPQEAPKSLTRAGMVGTAPAAALATPPSAATPSPTPQPAAALPASSPKPLDADIAVGQIVLHGGHINYTDNFINPHYTADLTDVSGKIGAFGTQSTEPAAVALGGQLNGSAPINISGSTNPLTLMALVDLTAKADRVELTGLSTYSAKYTGYPITKGTLTVDVHYLLDKRMLTATNHIYIDQLTFGDHVTDPHAANLPVRLAVALLADSHGVIDLKIPVSGSLNDPRFSIGDVVWAAFKNLVVKALTSPFTLIASAFGGSGAASHQDLNYVEFQPGYAELTADARSRLAIIAKALRARPALKLEISGRVDPTVDREALRQAELEHLIEQQKAKDVGEAEGGTPVTVDKDEYDKYLKRAYKAAPFEKPTNLLGLTASLPPDEMKKLMLANMDASDNALKQLADARANAVRAALSRAQIDPNRLFIGTSKRDAAGITDKGKTSRVDLTLK